MAITEYTFPVAPADTGYCVFPAVLEDDPLVLFHATPAVNFDAIMKDGFKIPDPNGTAGLPSVSFAKRSVSSLTHAMETRSKHPGAWCIFAVRYLALDGVTENYSDIHDCKLDPHPEIIGYCIVPATYNHV